MGRGRGDENEGKVVIGRRGRKEDGGWGGKPRKRKGKEVDSGQILIGMRRRGDEGERQRRRGRESWGRGEMRGRG